MSGAHRAARKSSRFPTARKVRKPFAVIAALSVVMLGIIPLTQANATDSPSGASISSDLADYPPGATVNLIGQGWAPGEEVSIKVDDASSKSWSHDSDPDPVAGADGSLDYSFQLPSWFVSNYEVTAIGPVSGTATTTFTDLSIGTYDQCSNDLGDGYGPVDVGCRWINGNLQGQNSIYKEGDATVQRVWLTQFAPGTTHTLTLKYGTTKGGKHAYDFLTTWDWSEDWIQESDRCQDITGCVGTAESKVDIPQDPNVPNSFEPSAPTDRQFVMRGGTLNSATTPAVVSGSYAGDSETVVTVSFTVPSSGPMCNTDGCSVALWFGAHVSAQANWGLGQGAGSISGSPYHVALDSIDNAAVGQRDNQMQASAVTATPNGTITIVKDAVPNDAQDFSFNLNNNSTINQNFSLDDDGDPTLPNSQTFSVPPGTWSASELNIPTGWDLTGLVCVDPTNNTTTSLANATASINLASNETVTCTFTNTPEIPDVGSLKITKTVDAGGSSFTSGSFDVQAVCTKSGATDLTFNRTIAYPNPGFVTINGIPSGYSCTVTETGKPTAPVGYTWGTEQITGSPASITLQNPAEVTVANTLTRDLGNLKLSKTLSGGPDGYTGPFTIAYDCDDGTDHDGSAILNAGQSTTINGIPTGTKCTVSETVPNAPTGYTFGTPTFTPSATVTITPKDATVEVTVANTLTRDLGNLKLSKTLSGGPDGYTGPFTIAYDCDDGTDHDGSAILNAGQSTTINGIPTGTKCTVSETVPNAPTGYTFGTPTFTPSATVTITPKDATVEVTVANTLTRDLGNLKLSKTLSGGPDGYTGPFTIAYDCDDGTDHDGSAILNAGQSTTINGIPTGTKCTVSETVPNAPTGYTFGTPTFTPSATVTITPKDATVEVTVANTLTRDLGNLKLSKTLSGGPDGYTGPFTIAYDCDDGTDHDGSAILNAGQSTTINGIPTGTKCTVSETVPNAPTGYTFGTPTFTPSATVTITPKDATVEVTVANTLTRDLGNLKLSKTLSGGPDGYTGPFTIAYDCDDGTDHDGSAILNAGQSTTINGIPTGTKCTVSETVPNAPTGYTFGTPTFTPSATVTITPKDATVEVTVANTLTRDLGNLKLSKTLSGGPDGYTGPFTIAYDCDDGTDHDGSAILNAGQSTTINGIPTGTKCTVSETVPNAPTGYTFGTPTFTPSATVTITPKDATVEVTVANTLTRDLGNLKLSKTLSGGPDGYTGPFTIAYDCDDGTDHDGSAILNAGQSTTINGIPTGTKCTVSETVPNAPTGYTFGTPTFTPSATVTITPKDATVEVTVANTLTRDLGNLKLSKTLSGGPDGYTGPFTIAYDCDDGTDHDGSAILNAGQSTTINGIPTGTKCTVSETVPNAPTGYTFGTPTFTPSATVTITPKDATVEVTVANTLTRDLGNLKLSKTLSGGPDGYTGPFTIAYDCDDGTDHDGSAILNAGQSTTINGIPTGTKCTVSETVPNAPTGYTFGTPTFTPSNTVTIASGNGSSVTVTTNNTLTRDLGSLRITKTVTGGPAGFTGSFNVSVVCTGDGGSYTRSITYPTPGYVDIAGIPTGNTCTVTETGKSAPPTGYIWGSATITGSPATISRVTTAQVTVTNPLLIKSGALTIGFWQNKNGQGIVKNYSGVNCVDLAKWLNGTTTGSPFASTAGPFKDVPVGPCGSSPSIKKGDAATGVVGYVYKVIKAASCTSSSKTCNSMLKAQMLASALNVYFSDPALGGNRIGAFNGNGSTQLPIGSLKVDLASICKMIGSSGGTSTCSGAKYTLAQVQSVLGVPSTTTSLTVNQLLSRVASYCLSSNGLTAWYGQDKAKQVVAKDIFDSINNEAVVIAP